MSDITVLEHPDLGTRFRVTEIASDQPQGDDGADVVAGLLGAPKTLPARYFYDAHGSELFEDITALPEYYLTRTEEAILRERAAEIAAMTGDCDLIELGSGSSSKTRALLRAYLDGGYRLRYLPIDVSDGILKPSAEALLAEFPTLELWGLVGTYESALAHLPRRELPWRMAMFLGSTMGNLSDDEADRFLARVRKALEPGECFLVGTDLHKPAHILEAAYNDADGVTAEFNINMLRHLNARFNGDFDLDAFSHHAFYNAPERRIEMHLVSHRAQRVTLADLDLTVEFGSGETVRTEISRKFDLPVLKERFAKSGFKAIQTWTDDKGYYGLTAFRAV